MPDQPKFRPNSTNEKVTRLCGPVIYATFLSLASRPAPRSRRAAESRVRRLRAYAARPQPRGSHSAGKFSADARQSAGAEPERIDAAKLINAP